MWRENHYVKVLNGFFEQEHDTYDREGEVNGVRVDLVPLWTDIRSYGSQLDAYKKAIAQSKKYPTELFYVDYNPSFYPNEDTYFLNGEQVFYRKEEYNERTRRREWRTEFDVTPYYANLKPIVSYSISFNEVTLQVEEDVADTFYSVAAMVAYNTRKGYATKYSIRRVEMAEGSKRYFVSGKEVDSLDGWYELWSEKTELYTKLIVPKNYSVREVRFTEDLFKTTRVNDVREKIEQLVILLDHATGSSINEKQAMEVITNYMHVALENIDEYLQNRSKP